MHPQKERWLHARISEGLEDALKREARRRRQPVSMLGRDFLDGALDLVEELVAPSATRAADPDGVYGWQELVLNVPGACGGCGAALDVGVPAWRGLRERQGPPVFRCVTCLG